MELARTSQDAFETSKVAVDRLCDNPDDCRVQGGVMKKVRSHLLSTTRVGEPPHLIVASGRPTLPPAPNRPDGLTAFHPVETAPPMTRRNGIGTILLGRIRDPSLGSVRVKLLWLTILFVPVLPLRAYAVSGGIDGYRFHGAMGLWCFLNRYRWRVLPYLFTVLVEAALRAVLLIGLALFVSLFIAWLFGRV
jgi:hypothetical protein